MIKRGVKRTVRMKGKVQRQGTSQRRTGQIVDRTTRQIQIVMTRGKLMETRRWRRKKIRIQVFPTVQKSTVMETAQRTHIL